MIVWCFRLCQLSVLTACFYSTFTHAANLSSLAALAFDEPNYRSAVAEQQAAVARYQQSQAALLPQISLSANSQANQRTYRALGDSPFLNLEEQKDRYNSHGWQANFTQPLWRYSLWADRAQANAQQQQTTFQLSAAEQNTLSKLAEAWFELLIAADQQRYSLVQQQMADEFYQVTLRGSQLGLRSLPELHEAASKQSQAQSEVFSAKQELQLKQAALALIIGQDLNEQDIPTLKDNSHFPRSDYSLENWLQLIDASNSEIQSAYYQQEAAREEIGKQLGGHLPSLDLVANYNDNRQHEGSTPSQSGYDSVQHYIGVQANWNLWQSGGQYAKVKEARARFDKAEANLELAKRTTRFNGQQAWLNQQIAIAKQHSSLATIQALRSQLRALQQGTDIGLKSRLDQLRAQEQLASTERDYRKAVYQQLLAFIKLEGLANQLTPHDFQQVDALFTQNEVSP